MYTYDVVSESAKNPHELAAELTRRSAAGWEVVQIVFDGEHWMHAFIRHHGQAAVGTYPTATASIGSPAWDAQQNARTAAPAASTPGFAAASAPENVWQSASAGQSAASAPAGTSAVPSVPANWYKDPSGRYEMRYWNGSQWTEHVATAGKQSIDPPKK